MDFNNHNIAIFMAHVENMATIQKCKATCTSPLINEKEKSTFTR
jgi:hypothetical protein